MSGAEVFYAYHAPNGYSSNAGRHLARATSVYVIIDESLRTFMLITSDVPGRAATGTRSLSLSMRGSPSLEGANVSLLLADDATDYLHLSTLDAYRN